MPYLHPPSPFTGGVPSSTTALPGPRLAEAPERLGVALEQLPLHSEGRQAAAIVEMALVVGWGAGG